MAQASAVIALRGDLGQQEDKILSALSRAGSHSIPFGDSAKDFETRYEGTEKLTRAMRTSISPRPPCVSIRAQMAYQAAIQSGAKIRAIPCSTTCADFR
jgi:hypothetical protein